MDSQKKESLRQSGVNVDAALVRFMGNEAMLEKYLNRFLSEKSYAALTSAVKGNDQAGAQSAAHTLKSVCGTIGCDAMHQMVVAQEASMRAGDWDKAASMMDSIDDEYQRVCAALKAAL